MAPAVGPGDLFAEGTPRGPMESLLDSLVETKQRIQGTTCLEQNLLEGPRGTQGKAGDLWGGAPPFFI